MKIKYVFIQLAFLFFVLISCTNNKSIRVNYKNGFFVLPINIEKAKHTFGLTYNFYSGFQKGLNVNSPDVLAQIKGYPCFHGSDNDSEESYFDQNFVGISFREKCQNFDSLVFHFKHKHNRKFKFVRKSYFAYAYFQLSNGLIISLKKSNTQLNRGETLFVCFHNGIEIAELEEYLKYI